MFKMLLLPSPGWVKTVAKNGKPASAEVRSDPKEILKGVAGYQGRDGWVDAWSSCTPATTLLTKRK